MCFVARQLSVNRRKKSTQHSSVKLSRFASGLSALFVLPSVLKLLIRHQEEHLARKIFEFRVCGYWSMEPGMCGLHIVQLIPLPSVHLLLC